MYKYIKRGMDKYLVEGEVGVKFNISGNCVCTEKFNPVDIALYPTYNIISIVKSGTDFISVGLQQGDSFTEKTYRTKKYHKISSIICEERPEDMLRNSGTFEGVNFVQTIYVFNERQDIHQIWDRILNRLKEE